MFNKMFGQVICKDANSIFVENEYCLKQIYIHSAEDFVVGSNYKIYIFQYVMIGNKSIEKQINFGFLNLKDAIEFENLLLIDGIGIKTALKIIKYGHNELYKLIYDFNIYEISQKFGITSNIANNLINFFNKKEMENYTKAELNKLKTAIANLQNLGYAKKLSEKIVWKRKDEIINNKFSNIFHLLIEDIKNERINN